MKCLCFSDSHGSSYYLNKVISMHPDAEVVFFLGDGLADIERVAQLHPEICFLPVRGNCDTSFTFRDSIVKKTESVNLEGIRITYTHGDLYGAKYGMGGLLKLAEETDSQLVLFGHTHIPHESYQQTEKGGGVYLFNPGSIGMGGFSAEASFGVIMIDERGILLSHGTIR